MPNDANVLADALRRMADLAATAAPAAVATAMAEATAEVVRAKLGGGPPPSPAGSPPARRSGALQESIVVTPPVESVGYAETLIGPDIVYGRIHELGGDTGRNHATHLEPRPYLTPSVEETYPANEALAAETFARTVGLG